jgi:hypothetical protein
VEGGGDRKQTGLSADIGKGITILVKSKSKAIPVTGRGGL